MNQQSQLSDETAQSEAPPTQVTAPQTPGFYLSLSAYWFAHSFLWAGLITIVVQRLVEEMAGKEKDLYLGIVLATGAVISTFMSLLAGTISDRTHTRFGRRIPFIVAGTLLSIPPLMMFPFVGSIPALIAAFCALQFFINIGIAPYEALIPDLVPKARQGTASAYMGLSSILAQLGGIVLCGMLITKPHGLLIIMSVISGVMVVAMLWTMWRIRENTAPAHEPKKAEGNFLQTLLASVRVNPREHPDFFRLIASRFVINTGFYTATQFLLFYLTDTLHAPNPTQLMTKLSLLSLVSGLLGNFPAGMLSDRISKKQVVYASAAITGVGALIFVTTHSIAVAYGAAFLFGTGFGAFQAVDWALATNLLPERDEAKFLGLWNMAFTVPQVVAPIVGGVIAYFFNTHVAPGFGYRVVLFLVIIYLFIGTLLIRPIRERVNAE